MILTCERCHARYAIDPIRLGEPGRKVRCSSCGHVWRYEAAPEARTYDRSEVERPAQAAPRIVESQPSSEPRDPPPIEEPKLRAWKVAAPPPVAKPKGRIAKIVALGAPTLLFIAALALFHNTIIDIWPPSARLYAPIGLAGPVADPGLSIRSVKLTDRMDNGVRTVFVEGDVANVGSEARSVPTLHASLIAGNDVVARWSFNTGTVELPPGKASHFHTEFANAPAEGQSVWVGLRRQ